MAPSMSVVLSEPQKVWSADDVTISDVLNALGEIRGRFARDEAHDDHVHPRNCVMTLIGVAPTEADELSAMRTAELIGTQHPALSIVIREAAPMRGRHLDASITTQVQRPQIACPTECEIITLHVRPAPGQRRAHVPVVARHASIRP
jgi:hypothetical protein